MKKLINESGLRNINALAKMIQNEFIKLLQEKINQSK